MGNPYQHITYAVPNSPHKENYNLHKIAAR